MLNNVKFEKNYILNGYFVFDKFVILFYYLMVFLVIVYINIYIDMMYKFVDIDFLLRNCYCWFVFSYCVG